MNTEVYDLTGSKTISFGCASGADDMEIIASFTMRDLLITPRELHGNRRPYLQDPSRPFLEDIHAGGMEFSYECCAFLEDILKCLHDVSACQQLESFFLCQHAIRAKEYCKRGISGAADWSVLLVPDDWDVEKQEKLLRSCRLPRRQTFLLWRSVAGFLGAEVRLKDAGVRANGRVAVLDVQSGRVCITVLTVREEGGRFVPCRKSFRPAPCEDYPVWGVDVRSAIPSDSETEFWRHTSHRPGLRVVPTSDGWAERDFPEPETLRYYLPPEVACSIDCCVVIGKIRVTSQELFLPVVPIADEDVIRGAGRFAVRQAHGLPTYYDQCEPLIFIIQDTETEAVRPVELIPGNEFCCGGSTVKGDARSEFYLEKENDHLVFLLNIGSVESDTPLKELRQAVGHETKNNQPLILYPEMIPGQGIATVSVDARPLIREPVLLDFLQMTPSEETLAGLQQQLKRSFPIDFPDVKASTGMWNSEAVSRYLKTGQVDSGLLARTVWPNLKKTGMERFQRVNVFGTNPDYRVPDVDAHILETFYRKISRDYDRNAKRGDAIRLAAWTYQSENPQFAKMIRETLNRIRRAAEFSESMLKQEFTLCANLLSQEQQREFIHCFIKRTKEAIRRAEKKAEIQGVDEWIRALSEILMYNRDVLSELSTSVCVQCASSLYAILNNYRKHRKHIRFIRCVVKALLFLLKRRRYDRGFLGDSATLRRQIIRECGQLQTLSSYRGMHLLCASLADYMNGNGTLDGLPAGDSGESGES